MNCGTRGTWSRHVHYILIPIATIIIQVAGTVFFLQLSHFHDDQANAYLAVAANLVESGVCTREGGRLIPFQGGRSFRVPWEPTGGRREGRSTLAISCHGVL